MIVQALGQLVLGCVQHNVVHKFAVMQHLFAVLICVVIPVDHIGFAVVVDQIFGDELAHADRTARQRRIAELRILLLQQITVNRLQIEYVPAALDIVNPRLPEQTKQIHTTQRDVAETVELRLVPVNAVCARAVLELLPQYVGIYIVELVLLQHAGDDRREHLRDLLVAFLAGKDVRLRDALDAVRVLADDDVEQPSGRGFHAVACALFLHPFPMADFPPLLQLHDPRVKLGLSGHVAGQGRVCLVDALLRHLPHRLRLPAGYKPLHRVSAGRVRRHVAPVVHLLLHLLLPLLHAHDGRRIDLRRLHGGLGRLRLRRFLYRPSELLLFGPLEFFCHFILQT